METKLTGLSKADAEAFEEMAHRLELTRAWNELGCCRALGYMVIPSKTNPLWRAMPIARWPSAPIQVSQMSASLLHTTTGRRDGEYTPAETREAQATALIMMAVFCKRVTA